MKTLYMAWQDQEDRSWFPVGKLTLDDDAVYRFVYTKGAEELDSFVPFERMRNLKLVYESIELFPLFSNRLMRKSRPEYRDFLDWLNLQKNEDDPISLLARSEGIRATDSLTDFPHPEKNDKGEFHLHFFSNGIRYLEDQVVKKVNNLEPDNQLFLMPDPQNSNDKCAIAVRTDDPPTVIGYCPRYLSKGLLELLKNNPNSINVVVERVNDKAPLQLRLLCSLSAEAPKDFDLCSGKFYQPISS